MSESGADTKLGFPQWYAARKRLYRCPCATCFSAYSAGWESVGGEIYTMASPNGRAPVVSSPGQTTGQTNDLGGSRAARSGGERT